MPGLTDPVRAAAATRPHHPALIDESARLSWQELDATVTRAALSLLGSGLAPGARVAVQLGTSVDFVTAYLGAARAGLVPVPVNPGYTPAELRHILADSGAELLVTTSVAAIEERADLPVSQVLVAARSAPEGLDTWAGLLAAAAGGPDPRADRAGEQLGVLLYTSGTSGRPRGAMLSVRALLANLDQLGSLRPPLLGADDVAFMPLPAFHVFGLNGGLGLALRAGATAVLADRFDPDVTLASMAEHRATTVVGAPGMFAQWLGRPGFAAAFETVRFALSGAAPLPVGVVAGYAAAGIALHEGYGLTEAAPGVTMNLDPDKPGSVGRPLPGVQVARRDPVGDAADADDPGELLVRGANLFSGYWPDAADGPDDDGWWATGDIAVADSDGDLYLVGRTSDLVLVNGFNVYPAEVERALTAQPGVAEAAVLGIDDRDTGEAVVAYVVPERGASLSVEDLLAGVATSLARFKLPRRIELVEALPHSATGKVMKWRLTERRLRSESEAERRLRSESEAERRLRSESEAERRLRSESEAERRLRSESEAERRLRSESEAERRLRSESEAERRLRSEDDAADGATGDAGAGR